MLLLLLRDRIVGFEKCETCTHTHYIPPFPLFYFAFCNVVKVNALEYKTNTFNNLHCAFFGVLVTLIPRQL